MGLSRGMSVHHARTRILGGRWIEPASRGRDGEGMIRATDAIAIDAGGRPPLRVPDFAGGMCGWISSRCSSARSVGDMAPSMSLVIGKMEGFHTRSEITASKFGDRLLFSMGIRGQSALAFRSTWDAAVGAPFRLEMLKRLLTPFSLVR